MSTFVWFFIIGIVLLAVFGLWPLVWDKIKSAFSATGHSVPDNVDAWVTNWLNTSESVVVQGLLRRARLGFAKRGDDKSVAACNELITQAATWDDVTEATDAAAN